MNESLVSVRYIVDDAQTAADWYVEHLGFRQLPESSSAFAAVQLGVLKLLLSGRTSLAGRPTSDGRQPAPGGWGRFQIVVADIDADVERLKQAGVRFPGETVKGPKGAQALMEDISGNLIELFQSFGNE